jgi:hypothetical protein
MGLEPLNVTLSSFEKLEILRSELKEREAELQKVEQTLRTALRELATFRYLKSVSPFYSTRATPPEASSVPELEKRRQALFQLIQTLRSEISRTEAAASGGKPAPPASNRGEVRRSRFE